MINSENCLKTTDPYVNNTEKKEENNLDLSKQNLPINKYSYMIPQYTKDTLITEDKLTYHIQSEEFFAEREIKIKDEKLQIENPLLPIRLWSPYVLDDDQSIII